MKNQREKKTDENPACFLLQLSKKHAGFWLPGRRYCFRPGILTLLLFSALLLFSSFQKHDFHSSLAEMHYNAASKSLEVSLRVFSDDLEAALTKDNNRTIKVNETESTDPLIKQYLVKHFALMDARNTRKPIQWIGKELTVDVTWLYFEIPLAEDMKGFKLQNSVMFDLFDNQVNIVNMNYRSQKRTYLFKPDQRIQTVE